MKKPYQKPTVTKIALNYQQAVLAGCSLAASSPSNRKTTGCLSSPPTCRFYSGRKPVDVGIGS